MSKSKSKKITNTSYHEFLMPFFMKDNSKHQSCICNNTSWLNLNWYEIDDESAFYFKAESIDSLANEKQKYGIKHIKDNYFNNSAKKLLGLTDDDVCTIYKRKNLDNSKLLIKVEDIDYKLKIINIMLYKTNFDTFLLRITTKYEHNPKNGDMLTAFRKINDYGRRIYLANVSNYNGNSVRSIYTADSIVLITNNKKRIEAKFEPNYNEVNNYSSEVINYILYGSIENVFRIGSCLDDRMFVCATLVDDESYKQFKSNGDYICSIANNLEKKIKNTIDKELYRLIYVDGSECSCYDKFKRREDISNSIYTRWMPDSLYSITDYSYLHLTGDIDYYYLIDNDINIYGEMACLALLQKSTVLYVSDNLDEKDDMKNRIVKLMKDINIMDVTEQIQGKEMYDMFKDKMNISGSIELLNSQLTTIHERDNEVESDNLNLLLFAFTVISVVNDTLSIDFIKNAKPVYIPACIVVLIAVLCIFAYKRIVNKKTENAILTTRIVIIFIIVFDIALHIVDLLY